MSNHLINETSPYLLQHAENPVDWYPWCDEAFERAKAEDKPIFLSVGYSTCHWCHVMARESFEDTNIAEILNRAFVAVKVDREERPDIDSVYMTVCQALTGSGGWPMSVFLTWDKKPFFAGTYFPPRARYGAPGFADLLSAIETQWNTNRAELVKSAERIVARLSRLPSGAPSMEGQELAREAVRWFRGAFDEGCGGFGDPPKFPTPHNLLFLLLYADQRQDDCALQMAEKTLVQMRKGGIFDQIGGGFSRYSTDRKFLVPHFEKMLYDNALLIMAYAAAYCATGKPLYLATACDTAGYVLREMTSDEGGFYSAQDADSDGVEGKFYTFTLREVLKVLGKERGGRFARVFDITGQGNFEGANIPNLLKSNELSENFGAEKEQLRLYRERRGGLHLDDKILTTWNAMMIAALSMLYRVSANESYLQAAVAAQRFLESSVWKDGRLFAGFRKGKRSQHDFLDDYAYETAALIELYNSTLDRAWLEKAERLCGTAVRRFKDQERGGFFLSEKAELFLNPKETYDGAIPSANAVMAYDLVRLYQLTGQDRYRELAEQQLTFLSAAADVPAGHSMFLLAKQLYELPPRRITFVWKEAAEREECLKTLPFLANVTAMPPNQSYPLLNGRATWYVCRGQTCLPPSNTRNF